MACILTSHLVMMKYHQEFLNIVPLRLAQYFKLFTQSMLSEVLPNDRLSASIMPVFKKGGKGNPSNYRPISLTAICCKIMEHMEYLENYITISMDSDRAVLQKHK